MRYTVVHLLTLIDDIGDVKTTAMLSDFSCPLAPDVEMFIQTKAIDFAKQGWSQTHLVFTSYKGEPVLVGYFTLASKVITVPLKNVSKTVRRRIAHFSTYDSTISAHCLSVPLIAQIGKNFTNGYNKLIDGSELLEIACDKVSNIQLDLGGRYAYLECEDIPALVEFYKENGFIEFDRRYLDLDETPYLSGDYLIQMLRLIKRR
ncbi:MAG: N-acetyltransferase [Oscillospiraceae bacterium]|nr:N-acetyltransferase [Oscillospiraceae bacterium]